MDKDLNVSDSRTGQEIEDDQSLVGKLKKNVSEIISNTPLSKWFRKQNDATPSSSIRRRQDDSDDDEDLQEFQPPTKRTKLPPTKETISLNVSEVLSPITSVNHVKKPLYMNFPEPVAGPSGYETRKMLNSTSFGSESCVRTIKDKRIRGSELTVDNKESQSDSEESTSGYSSGRVGSKEIISQESSKQTSPLQNSPKKTRSLFESSGRLFVSDRSLSPNRNSNLSSRMPSFDPSTFGSTSVVDRTLATNKILNSPFYNGRTIYGGAAAYGRGTRRAPQDIEKILRQSVKIKPTNKTAEKGDLQLGKTARRILDTLEQYSSPVSDAKKIPVASKKYKSEGSLTRFIGANPYVVRESRSASARELQVPSVTDLLKLKMDQHKSKLQSSTEAARQIATKSTTKEYQIPIQKEMDKHTSKMRSKITSVRKKVVVEEVMPEVNLTPISLPIKELPKFDLVVPPPPSSDKPVEKPPSPVVTAKETIPTPIFNFNPPKSATVVEPKDTVPLKETEPPKNIVPAVVDKPTISKPEGEFKFSAPLVLAEYLKPLKALNNFKFSEPLVKKRRSIHPELDDQENKSTDSNKIKKNNGENVTSWSKVSNTKDSLMEKFKAKEGTWECSECMIRNQPQKNKCVACESPRPKSKSTSEPAPTFGTPINFKPAENTWECPTCMIRNKDELEKCAACEEKKPNKSTATSQPSINTTQQQTDVLWDCSSCHAKNIQLVSQCHRCQKPKVSISAAPPGVSPVSTTPFGFGTKFSTPSNTWECSTCMIRNKDEVTKCVACETPKPQSKSAKPQNIASIAPNFANDFKKKEDEWECSVCMVRNKAAAAKCQCCESENPNAKSSAAAAPPKVSAFNFGIDKNTAASFTFGIPPEAQSEPKTNAAAVFGANKSAPVSATPSFSFGVPAKDTKEVEPKKEEPKKEEPVIAAPTAAATPTFSFGSKPTEVKSTTTSETKATEATPTFSFGLAKKSEAAKEPGAASIPTFSFGTPKTVNGEESKKTTPPTFSFGTPVSKNEAKSASTPSFTFGTPKKSEDDRKSMERINPLLKPNEKLPEKAAVAPVGFSFGVPKSSTSPASVLSTSISTIDPVAKKRSRPDDDNQSSIGAKAPMFSFKAPTTNGDISTKSGSLFGKPAEETSGTNKPAPVGGFNFNLNTGKTTTATVAPTFSSSQPDAAKHPATALFNFASSSETPKHTNGFNFSTSAPTFGAKTAETKPFTFGSPAAQNATTSFGATPAKTNLFTFGSAASTNENKPGGFSFNAPVPETKPPPPQFPSFGSSGTPKAAPQFSFGQSTAAPSFSFGGSANNQTAPSPFGGATSNKPESLFGAVPAQQSTGMNGSFNFGTSTATNQKAMFSFGASGTSGSDGMPTMPGGLGFGSSAMNAGTTGGFNFTTPTFDANSKPTFNFTGGAGLASFSAPPSQDGALPQRKIKKAVRRTVR